MPTVSEPKRLAAQVEYRPQSTNLMWEGAQEMRGDVPLRTGTPSRRPERASLAEMLRVLSDYFTFCMCESWKPECW